MDELISIWIDLYRIPERYVYICADSTADLAAVSTNFKFRAMAYPAALACHT